MKNIILVACAMAFSTIAFAQPTKTRANTANNNSNQQQVQQKVDRASIMYPTAVAQPEDVSWRRDVYRELDLRLDENAPLYYPETPKDGEQNLFFTLFRLLNVGKIPAYNYKTDGTEHFDRSNRMHFKDMLERYEVFYEIDSARRAINVRDADVPSSEVLSYFVKESSYYDQNTATFHTRVVALCPVLHRAAVEFSYEAMSMDEDGGVPVTKYPMFWVKFEDIEPYISKQMVMVSNINNASKMSIADFLATNKYKGRIYMTNNMQNKTIMDYCPTDSAVNAEQVRLEREMLDFEQHLWNPPLDSAAIAKRDSVATAKELQSKKGRRSRKAEQEQTKKEEITTDDSGENGEVQSRTDARRNVSDEPEAEQPRRTRVSARRQRH